MFSIRLMALLIILCTAMRPVAAFSSALPSGLQGAGIVLADMSSGRLLYERNGSQTFYPASITKILTAVVVLERLPQDRWVTVSSNAASQEGSSMYLRSGDQLRVVDLLYGMMMTSGNDAAVALAEATAGDVASFARLMNLTADRLGADSSHFVNPSGLPDPDQVTTARDMAIIARYAMNHFPLFRTIVQTLKHDVHFRDGRTRTIYSHNAGLTDHGFDGIKTGYTIAARHTYVASMTQDAWQLLAVTLKTSRQGKYQDAKMLFDYGFTAFTPVDVGAQIVDQIDIEGVSSILPIHTSNLPIFVPLRRDGSEAAVYRYEYDPVQLQPPIDRGQKVGMMKIYVNDTYIRDVPLYAGSDIKEMPGPDTPGWWIFLRELWRVARLLPEWIRTHFQVQ